METAFDMFPGQETVFPAHESPRQPIPSTLYVGKNSMERRNDVKKFKVRLNWIQSGAKTSTEELLKWVEGGQDKELSKKRLTICAAVAGGAVLLVVQVPVAGPSAIVLGALAVFAWFDRTPQEEMRMRFSDFSTETFVIGDEEVPGMEVLRKYIQAHPDKTPVELAEYLSQAPGSPVVSPRLMAGVMAELGIPAPRKEADQVVAVPKEGEAGGVVEEPES
jgi:hypothetical protein